MNAKTRSRQQGLPTKPTENALDIKTSHFTVMSTEKYVRARTRTSALVTSASASRHKFFDSLHIQKWQCITIFLLGSRSRGPYFYKPSDAYHQAPSLTFVTYITYIWRADASQSRIRPLSKLSSILRTSARVLASDHVLLESGCLTEPHQAALLCEPANQVKPPRR